MILTKRFDYEKYKTVKQNFKSIKFIMSLENDKMTLETDDTNLINHINSNFIDYQSITERLDFLESEINKLKNPV